MGLGFTASRRFFFTYSLVSCLIIYVSPQIYADHSAGASLRREKGQPVLEKRK